MDENEQKRRDFIALVNQVLSDRPGAGVLVLIDGQKGFETLQNVDSYVFSFGLLKSANEVFEARYRSLIQSNEALLKQIDEEAKMQLLMANQSGVLN